MRLAIGEGVIATVNLARQGHEASPTHLAPPMSLQPLLQSDPAVQVHAASAILAVIIGAFVLWRRKGTRLHRVLGRLWVLLMLATATSALFIHSMRVIGPFGPIHIFCIITYVSVFNGLRAVIVRRDIARHRAEMQGLYINALLFAGAFTFLPGRRMHQVLFGPDAGWPESLLAISAVLAVALFATIRRRRKRPYRSALRPSGQH
jgi:uncharacterized membrane protein